MIAPTIAFPKSRFRCFNDDINDSITKSIARNSALKIEGAKGFIFFSFSFLFEFIFEFIFERVLIIFKVRLRRIITIKAVKNPVSKPLKNFGIRSVIVWVSMLKISMKKRAIASNNTKKRTRE